MGEIRSSRGDCPAPEVLARFATGDLDAAQSADIKRHVLWCGRCDLLLDRISAFDDESREVPASPSRANWFRFLKHPALAYALAAVLAVPAYHGVFPGLPEVPAPPPSARDPLPALSSAGSGAILDLAVTRGAETQSETSADSAATDFLILRVWLPPSSTPHRPASIVNAAGDPVVRVSALPASSPDGRTLFVCRANLLPPGKYKLMIGPADSTFEFPFSIAAKF